MKTLVIELVDSSQSRANSGACSLPVIKLRQQRLGKAESEICRHHPFNNEGGIVVEGIGVGSSRYLMVLLAIEVCL